MPRLQCPKCRADLDDDLVVSTGHSDCPYCGNDVSELFVGLSAADAGIATSTARSATVPTKPDSLAADPLPPKSQIELVESGPERLVVHIPPGGKYARGLGCFALFWNGFMLVFTPPWFFAMDQADAPPLLFIIPFLGIFWAVGLGMAYFWFRQRFTRTYLLLEADRLVIQRMLFNWKSLTETYLNRDSSAELDEAYSQNDVPVYRIAVSGSNRTAKFGTPLSDEEKLWLVDLINRFLGVDERASNPTAIPGETGASASSASKDITVAAFDPSALTERSQIRIEENMGDYLRVHLPAIPPGTAQTVITGFLTVFSFTWTAGALLALWNNEGLVPRIMAAFFSLVGLAPLALALFLRRGRITIEIDPEWFQCRWHTGPLGYSKRIPTTWITRVNITNQPMFDESKLDRSHRSERLRRRLKQKQSVNKKDQWVCYVHTPETWIPLTMFHELGTVKEVAGVVRYQLERLRIPLQDV